MATKTDKMPKALISPSHWLRLIIVVFGIIGALYLWIANRQSQVFIYVPARDLPAYHQIQQADLIRWRYPERDLPQGAFMNESDIIGRYTLDTVPRFKPMTEIQLGPFVNADSISNTIPIAIEEGISLVMSEQLRPGSTITIWDNGVSILEGILILNLEGNKTNDNISDYIIVLAIPTDQVPQILVGLENETLAITLKDF